MSDENGITRKALESFELKDADKGEVEAIVATLGVVDRDREVITHDAIKNGSKVTMSGYGHDAVFGATPVGKGALHVEENKLVFRGKLFKTPRGQETLSVLKEMGTDQEWSFGFRVLGSEVPDEDWQKKGAMRILTKLSAFEVSPVLIGAGIGTQTVSAKQADEEAAAKAAADKKAEEERIAAETKAAQEATEQKARVTAAVAEYQRVQRSLKRLGLVA